MTWAVLERLDRAIFRELARRCKDVPEGLVARDVSQTTIMERELARVVQSNPMVLVMNSIILNRSRGGQGSRTVTDDTSAERFVPEAPRTDAYKAKKARRAESRRAKAAETAGKQRKPDGGASAAAMEVDHSGGAWLQTGALELSLIHN